jgi:uncharacterized protein (TIGR00269 family)
VSSRALCDVCGSRQAVIYQPHTGRKLCRECFIKDIEERIKNEVKKWNMIEPGDRILLGLSGGKDSYVLLDVLSKIHKPSRLLAVSIIEGIPGYNREEDVKNMKKLANDLGVDVIVTSIREYVGHSLYEIVLRALKRKLKISPCTYCGILRRRILNFYARIYGMDKVATAHNLDDEAQTAIINILRGDYVGLLRLHPLAPPASKKLVRRIKPLRKVYEWETTTYAYLKGFGFQETECMFINMMPTLRARVREALYELEWRKPGSLMRLIEILDSLLENEAKKLKSDSLGECQRCGEPTSPKRSKCKLCELLEKAGILEAIYQVPHVRLI